MAHPRCIWCWDTQQATFAGVPLCNRCFVNLTQCTLLPCTLGTLVAVTLGAPIWFLVVVPVGLTALLWVLVYMVAARYARRLRAATPPAWWWRHD